MEKFNIIVPRGIRYIGEWSEFNFNKFPGKCIINKHLPLRMYRMKIWALFQKVSVV